VTTTWLELLVVVNLLVACLILAGASQMLQLRRRWLAISAAVAAMLPINPTFLIGLPIGIWSLWVLVDPEVREAFHVR
jgi:predicted branched-subunit amino acid permease